MSDREQQRRQAAVARYLAGESPASIGRAFRRSPRWLFKWLRRQRSGRQDWFEERSRRPHQSPRQTPEGVQQAVLQTRQQLQRQELFCGAQAIAWQLEDLQVPLRPAVRTIGRILERHDQVNRRSKGYVPKGKKYPTLPASQPGQVQQMDFVGPCYLRGPVRFYSLHAVDLASGCCAVEVVLAGKQQVIPSIWGIWQRLGLPQYQQVDNEWVFLGSPAHPRGMGNLIRLCLPLGVEPVFIPMGEPWRNGVVEKLNCHWRQKLLGAVPMAGEPDLRQQSRLWEQKHNTRYRYSKLGGKTPQAALAASGVLLRYPPEQPPVQRPLPKPQQGRYHLVRFIRSDGLLDVFGEKFPLPPETVYEYVQATVDVGQQRLTVRLGEQTVDERAYLLR